MKADAVFEGGGVRGLGFVGAVCYLEEKGYTWERIAGTSAGSIIAALLSVGYKGYELKNIISQINYSSFLDKKGTQSIPFAGKYISLVLNKGFYQGDNIQSWIQSLLEAKGKTKFKHISINGKSNLKIIASDITKKDIIILPDDLSRYGLDPMEFDIAMAVRMSISIPLYFVPVNLNYGYNKSFIVDGGIISNFPVWIFDVQGVPRWPTIGFKLLDDASYTASGKTDLISFIQDIIGTIVDKNEERYEVEKNRVRTISINTLGIKATDFNITKEKSLELYKSGYNSAQQFLDTWNFDKYVTKYRKNLETEI